jgi:hypothetical protein
VWAAIAAIKPDDARWIFVSCGVIALAIILGGLGIWIYRKRVLFDDQASSQGLWTFEDLRQMRDRGDLTDQEYQALRAAMVGSFQNQGTNPGPTEAQPRSGSEDRRDFDLEKDREG